MIRPGRASPDHPQALVDLGSLWLRLGEPERAVAPLERAMALAPDNEVLRARLERARRGSSAAVAAPAGAPELPR